MSENLPFEGSGPSDSSQDFMAGLQEFAGQLAGYGIYSIPGGAFYINLASVSGSWTIPDIIPPEELDFSLTAAGLQELLAEITFPDFSSVFPSAIVDSQLHPIVKDILGI